MRLIAIQINGLRRLRAELPREMEAQWLDARIDSLQAERRSSDPVDAQLEAALRRAAAVQAKLDRAEAS
eukprot:8960820-Lingulodinium_polyedra.AAC.1